MNLGKQPFQEQFKLPGVIREIEFASLRLMLRAQRKDTSCVTI
jgi:hypothetical protein